MTTITMYQQLNGDRYFVKIRERSRRFFGDCCIWFRPEDSMTEPYRASVSVFMSTRPGIYESTARTRRHFSHWRDAEQWAAEEYQRLRQKDARQ